MRAIARQRSNSDHVKKDAHHEDKQTIIESIASLDPELVEAITDRENH